MIAFLLLLAASSFAPEAPAMPQSVGEADCRAILAEGALDPVGEEGAFMAGDVFVVRAEDADAGAMLGLNGIAEPFAMIADEAGGRTACIRVPNLDRALLEYHVTDSDGRYAGGMREFVGPGRYADPDLYLARSENAEVIEHAFDSARLSDSRRVFIYLPPDDLCEAAGGCPVVYTGDAMAAGPAGEALDALIRQGRIAPVIMASTMPDFAHRGQEYTPSEGNDEHAARFEAHTAFFLDEFIGWVEANHPVSSDPDDRILFGYSNSAVLALSLLERRPEMFSAAIAASPFLVEPVRLPDGLDGEPRHVRLLYGDWERTFADSIEDHAGGAENVDQRVISAPAGHVRQLAIEGLIDFLMERYGRE